MICFDTALLTYQKTESNLALGSTSKNNFIIAKLVTVFQFLFALQRKFNNKASVYAILFTKFNYIIKLLLL